MDIIHISSFGNLCYIHVTIDTFSQFIWTTTQSGEPTKCVQRHLYACFAVIKLPKTIKTDNGPAYTSRELQQFLKIWSIKQSTGTIKKLGLGMWPGRETLNFTHLFNTVHMEAGSNLTENSSGIRGKIKTES